MFWSFWVYFCSCFMSNKYYLSKLMLLKFRCQKISFLCKHYFFIDEDQARCDLDTHLKYFTKVFHVSWNAPETVFHEILWKKSYTVYPCRKSLMQIVEFLNFVHIWVMFSNQNCESLIKELNEFTYHNNWYISVPLTCSMYFIMRIYQYKRHSPK